MNNRSFLATTAISDFWDKNADKIIFLGAWCKADFSTLNGIDTELIDYIWKEHVEIERGILITDEVYDKVLKKLFYSLNHFHNVNHSEEYWNKLLMPWLKIYIQVLYDRYLHIKKAINQNPNVYTYTIADDAYLYLEQPKDFYSMMIEDEYNLQLYSQIIKFLSIDFQDISCLFCSKNKQETKVVFKSNIKNYILKKITFFANKVFKKKSILVVSPYFKKNILKKYVLLSLKSKFLFIFDNLSFSCKLQSKVLKEERLQLFSNISSDDEFENLIYKTLVYNMPTIYFELYNQMQQCLNRQNIPEINAVFSANALYSNEFFKFYVAKNLRTLKVLYSQHGGNYGIDYYNTMENIERSYSDVFFTYGWKDERTKVLSQLEQKKAPGLFLHDNGKINFIMTSMPRYFYRFTYNEDSSKMLRYIDNCKIFLSNIRMIDKMIIRLYMHDYGWNIKEKLESLEKKMTFDNETNYYLQIKSARINVFDHMHTGFLETFFLNKPTIIIITPGIYRFRKDALPFIEKLKEANILFENAEIAATFLNDNFSNIGEWWLSKKVQKTVDDFCFHYYRYDVNCYNQWIEALEGTCCD